MKYDPHGRAERLRVMVERIRDGTARLSKEDAKSICDFHRDMLAESMGIVRLFKYVETLRRLTRKLKKPLAELDKDDIKEIVIGIEGDQNVSNWTKHDFKVSIRRFFKWLRGGNKEYPPEVSWIKVHVRDKHKLPEDLLSEEEVKRIIGACQDARDRALVQCLYESGCRISEILTIQLKNIRFDEYGAVIGVTGKTGDRRVRLIASVPALTAWLEFHPFKDMPEAYLFVRRKFGKEAVPVPFRYEYAARIIRNLAKEAGITKRVHPHLFRHSRATALASKLTEAQMKEYFGWVQASDMASIYVHMSGRDVDDAILRINGMKKEDGSGSETFRQMPCARCGSACPPAAKLCTKCGFDLDTKAVIEPESKGKNKDELFSLLMKDPEFQAMILKKLAESNKGEVVEVIR